MLIAKLFFGALLVMLSVLCEILIRRTRGNTLALTFMFHNPEVSRRWVEQGEPQCLAYLTAARLGTACVGMIGVAVIGLNA